MQYRLNYSRDLLIKSGAHYVIDSIAELPEVCADINKRLAQGEKPWTQGNMEIGLLIYHSNINFQMYH